MAFATTHFAQQQRRLDRGHRCLLSFVLARSGDSATVESLLLVVAREHAEPYRDAGVERDAGEAIGDRATHVFEVWRTSTDDHAERDHRVVALLSQRLRRDRQLEGARNAQQSEVLDAGRAERPVGSVDERVSDLRMPTGSEDGHPKAVRVDGCSARSTTAAHPPTSTSSTSTGNANGDNECASRSALRTAAGSIRAARSATCGGNKSALASVASSSNAGSPGRSWPIRSRFVVR